MCFVYTLYIDTHTHTQTNTPCTYCMSVRQTVSIIGLFFSSPVWCTETLAHPRTHMREFDVWRHFGTDCCWGRRSAPMHAFFYRCVASVRAPLVEQQQSGIYRSALINAQSALQAHYRFHWSQNFSRRISPKLSDSISWLDRKCAGSVGSRDVDADGQMHIQWW